MPFGVVGSDQVTLTWSELTAVIATLVAIGGVSGVNK